MNKFIKNTLLITFTSVVLNSISFADEIETTNIDSQKELENKISSIPAPVAYAQLKNINQSIAKEKNNGYPIKIELKKVILESTSEDIYDVTKIISELEENLNKNGSTKKTFESYGTVIKMESTYLNTYSRTDYENITEEIIPYISSSDGKTDEISAINYNIMKFKDINENTIAIKFNGKDTSIKMNSLSFGEKNEVKLELPFINVDENEQYIVTPYGKYVVFSMLSSTINNKITTIIHVIKAEK